MRQIVVFTVLFAATVASLGQSAVDKQAIETIVADETAAWNAHDAKAFSAHFAADGSFTNIIGMYSYGVEPFRKQHERIFASIYKDTTASFTIDRLKMVRPDVALVDVNATLKGYTTLPPGIEPGADGALHTRLQMLLVKEQAGWQIAAFHNVVVAPAAGRP